MVTSITNAQVHLTDIYLTPSNSIISGFCTPFEEAHPILTVTTCQAIFFTEYYILLFG